MRKHDKRLRAWRNGARFDVRTDDALAVLREWGFELGPDGQNHWLAFHPKLRSHPQFPLGRLKINCHFKGKQGIVHPLAISDILRAITHLENLDDQS